MRIGGCTANLWASTMRDWPAVTSNIYSQLRTQPLIILLATSPYRFLPKKKKKKMNPGVSTMAQWVKIQPQCWDHYRGAGSIPGLVQWVKDPVLPHPWHRLQLELRLNPWPRNFHMPLVQPLGKKNLKQELWVKLSSISLGWPTVIKYWWF